MKPIDFKSRSKFRVAIKFNVAIVVIEMELNLSEIVSIYSSHNAVIQVGTTLKYGNTSQYHSNET